MTLAIKTKIQVHASLTDLDQNASSEEAAEAADGGLPSVCSSAKRNEPPIASKLLERRPILHGRQN
jgi:hypothetical protein